MRIGTGVILLVALMSTAMISRVYAQCSLDMHESAIPAQELSIADIDFEHFESRSLLFTINITNSGGSAATARLHCQLDVKLADGTNFPDAVDFTTDTFSIPIQGRMITNLALGRGGEIGTQSFSFNSEAKNRLQDVALSTGKFPSGRYVFHFEFVNGGCSSADVVFQLQNASRVELRSPQDGATINEFPFFEFFQEASQAVLTVAEKADGQSREDAISRTPPMLQVPVNGQNSFLYTGGRPLEQGKTYVWNIVSKSVGSGGTFIDVSSPIWSFTVSSSAQSPQGTILFDQLLQAFPRYKSLLQGLQKEGFLQVGASSLDGTALSEGDLLNLLSRLRDNDSVVLTVEE